MIEHLQGRENALKPLGWTGRKAEWIALACLHGDDQTDFLYQP